MQFCVELLFNDGSSAVLGLVTASSLQKVAELLNLGEERNKEGKVNPNCGTFNIPETNSDSVLEDCLWIHAVEEIKSAEEFREILEDNH